MPHTFTPQDDSLLDEFIREVEAKNALHDRIARYSRLLTKHGTSAHDFMEGLDPDELAFFTSCPPRLVFPEVRRWLGYQATRPTTTPNDRLVRVQHAWGRLYEREHAAAPADRHTLALRLRTVFTLRRGIIRWEPYDVPWALEEDFLDWLSSEAYEWAATLGREVFRGTVRSWLEEYFRRVGLPRLSGRPVPPMEPREHQGSFVSSQHFDLHLRRVAAEEGVEWEVELPAPPLLGVIIVSSQTA